MVWCQVNPNVVMDTLQFFDDKGIDEKLPAVIPVTHTFTQVRNPSQIVSEYKQLQTITEGDGEDSVEKLEPNVKVKLLLKLVKIHAVYLLRS